MTDTKKNGHGNTVKILVPAPGDTVDVCVNGFYVKVEAKGDTAVVADTVKANAFNSAGTTFGIKTLTRITGTDFYHACIQGPCGFSTAQEFGIHAEARFSGVQDPVPIDSEADDYEGLCSLFDLCQLPTQARPEPSARLTDSELQRVLRQRSGDSDRKRAGSSGKKRGKAKKKK